MFQTVIFVLTACFSISEAFFLGSFMERYTPTTPLLRIPELPQKAIPYDYPMYDVIMIDDGIVQSIPPIYAGHHNIPYHSQYPIQYFGHSPPAPVPSVIHPYNSHNYVPPGPTIQRNKFSGIKYAPWPKNFFPFDVPSIRYFPESPQRRPAVFETHSTLREIVTAPKFESADPRNVGYQTDVTNGEFNHLLNSNDAGYQQINDDKGYNVEQSYGVPPKAIIGNQEQEININSPQSTVKTTRKPYTDNLHYVPPLLTSGDFLGSINGHSSVPIFKNDEKKIDEEQFSKVQGLPEEGKAIGKFTAETIVDSEEQNQLTSFDVPILPAKDENADHGYYKNRYSNHDGSKVEEEGKLVAVGDGQLVVVKQGKYEQIQTDGTPKQVKWIADEGGFRIVAD